MKDEGGFDDKQMNILIDISDSRVAFTTEKKKRGGLSARPFFLTAADQLISARFFRCFLVAFFFSGWLAGKLVGGGQPNI